MALSFLETTIHELVVITPHQFNDEQGTFNKYFEKNSFEAYGLNLTFNELNIIRINKCGTLKGMPYQKSPSQARLIYCISGAVFDVALDLRRNSATFGRYECFFLSANDKAIYMPEHFAHGLLTLKDDTIICENFTGTYSLENCGRILWNDKDLNIPWPIDTLDVPLQISEKDRGGQTFEEYKQQNLM